MTLDESTRPPAIKKWPVAQKGKHLTGEKVDSLFVVVFLNHLVRKVNSWEKVDIPLFKKEKSSGQKAKRLTGEKVDILLVKKEKSSGQKEKQLMGEKVDIPLVKNQNNHI